MRRGWWAGAGLAGLVAIVASGAFLVGRGSAGGPTPAASPVAVASPVALASPVAVATPAATKTPAATASPSATPSAIPLEPVGALAATSGWHRRGELRGGDGTGPAGPSSFAGTARDGDRFILLTVGCVGSGSLHVAVGDIARDVACPVAAATPVRTMSFIEGKAYVVSVTSPDSIAWRVRIEGAPAPLRYPDIRIGSGSALMHYGCGMTLSTWWGYSAGDSCGTTLPLSPGGFLDVDTVRTVDGRVTVQVDGWTISRAEVACGRAVGPDILRFERVASCTARATRPTASSIRISGLPARSTPWLIELSLTLRDADGDEFSVPVYAAVRA